MTTIETLQTRLHKLPDMSSTGGVCDPAATIGAGEPASRSPGAEFGENSNAPDESLWDTEQFASLGPLEIIELVLKDPARLNRIIRDVALQPALIPRILAIELVAFTAFGVTLAVVLGALGKWPLLTPARDYLANPDATLMQLASVGTWQVWSQGMAFKMIAAYDLGLIAAIGICLPSLYFYGLLAGVRMSMLDVVIHAVKSQMTMGVALVGILPIYVAAGLGINVFELNDLQPFVIGVGLLLPFIAGLRGTHSLYTGFMDLADTLPPERRQCRECFLRRLLVSWSLCWTAVTPVMIYTLWTQM